MGLLYSPRRGLSHATEHRTLSDPAYRQPAAGSDCGYGTWVGQAAVDPDVVFAKLKAVTQGASLASRQFWG